MIGIFDSGVGGLTVYRHLRELIPQADVVYLADQKHAPYGERSLGEVAAIARACVGHLSTEGATSIVVACNTASAAALHRLRAEMPAYTFVGMEPALKPAAALTKSGVVGVLATQATFQGELFASLRERFAASVEVVDQPCPGWAQLVEAGQVDGPEVEEAVARHLKPVLARGADILVLGCTHYPFLRPVIERLAGPEVTIIDPAPAVAAQTLRVATNLGDAATTHLHTTGDPAAASRLVARLTGWRWGAKSVTLPGI